MNRRTQCGCSLRWVRPACAGLLIEAEAHSVRWNDRVFDAVIAPRAAAVAASAGRRGRVPVTDVQGLRHRIQHPCRGR
jgi:hypothetical protein